jgi:hypothetical protein
MSKAAELAKAGETLTNQPSGRKNIVTNGAMQIAQRATSSTGAGAANNVYLTVDRWVVELGATSAGRFTMTQTADGPSGFANCMKIDCTTADTSIAAGEAFSIAHRIEGQDVQQLKKGTSDAEYITVSWYAKGTAKTYGLEVYDADNDRNIHKLFTVSSSWQKFTATFPGDTTGALDDDNAKSLHVAFWVHAGATFTGGTLNTAWAANDNANRAAGIDSFFSSTDNELFITGVQMEVGSQATNFEHRSYGEELLLCSRYFYGHVTGNLQVAYNGGFYGNNSATGHVYFKVPMRAAPTPIKVTGADYFLVYAASDVVYLDGDISANDISVNGAGHYATTDATKTAGFACRVRSANAAARLGYDAEL